MDPIILSNVDMGDRPLQVLRFHVFADSDELLRVITFLQDGRVVTFYTPNIEMTGDSPMTISVTEEFERMLQDLHPIPPQKPIQESTPQKDMDWALFGMYGATIGLSAIALFVLVNTFLRFFG